MLMKIDRWKPRTPKRWERDQHGSRIATLRLEQGVVEVYSFPGDEKQKAFTALEMFIWPHAYQISLKRHYHDRWIPRLARDFAWRCYRWSKQISI
jgi:hypothetical protein